MGSGTNVLFVVTGAPPNTNASVRYRVFNFIPYLRAEGITCDVISLVTNDSSRLKKYLSHGHFRAGILGGSPRYDVVYIQSYPFGKTFTRMLNAVANDVIYDFDDAWHLSPPWEQINSVRRERVNHLLSYATHVIAGSPSLANYASEFADSITVLPTPIPREKYVSARSDERRMNHTVKLGWIGFPDNLRYLSTVEEAIESVLDSETNCELHIITSDKVPVRPFEYRIGRDVFYHVWSLDRELEYLSDIDVAVRPLTDDTWTRSKGGHTSVVQCMGLGIPVVASPVGMLEEIVVSGVNGYLADTEEEWTAHLSQLVNDDQMREELGSRAIQTIEDERFWTDQRASELATVIKGG